VKGLESFCKRLEADGYPPEVQQGSDCVTTDPWGTSIELTEGFIDAVMASKLAHVKRIWQIMAVEAQVNPPSASIGQWLPAVALA
jgi:hypothetical protein